MLAICVYYILILMFMNDICLSIHLHSYLPVSLLYISLPLPLQPLPFRRVFFGPALRDWKCHLITAEFCFPWRLQWDVC